MIGNEKKIWKDTANQIKIGGRDDDNMKSTQSKRLHWDYMQKRLSDYFILEFT